MLKGSGIHCPDLSRCHPTVWRCYGLLLNVFLTDRDPASEARLLLKSDVSLGGVHNFAIFCPENLNISKQCLILVRLCIHVAPQIEMYRYCSFLQIPCKTEVGGASAGQAGPP